MDGDFPLILLSFIATATLFANCSEKAPFTAPRRIGINSLTSTDFTVSCLKVKEEARDATSALRARVQVNIQQRPMMRPVTDFSGMPKHTPHCAPCATQSNRRL